MYYTCLIEISKFAGTFLFLLRLQLSLACVPSPGGTISVYPPTLGYYISQLQHSIPYTTPYSPTRAALHSSRFSVFTHHRRPLTIQFLLISIPLCSPHPDAPNLIILDVQRVPFSFTARARP